MKVAVKKDFKNIRLVDIGIRTIKEDEIRLKVKACGICGSDLIWEADSDQAEDAKWFSSQLMLRIIC